MNVPANMLIQIQRGAFSTQSNVKKTERLAIFSKVHKKFPLQRIKKHTWFEAGPQGRRMWGRSEDPPGIYSCTASLLTHSVYRIGPNHAGGSSVLSSMSFVLSWASLCPLPKILCPAHLVYRIGPNHAGGSCVFSWMSFLLSCVSSVLFQKHPLSCFKYFLSSSVPSDLRLQERPLVLSLFCSDLSQLFFSFLFVDLCQNSLPMLFYPPSFFIPY